MSTAIVASFPEPAAAPRSPTMKATPHPSQPRPGAKSASPGRRKKAKPAAAKERRASPPKPAKAQAAPSTPPSAAAVPNHWAVSAFQNSPDPKLIPLPDFDFELDAPMPPRVALEQTASLRRILNLA